MKELKRDIDADLPKKGDTISDWRWFAFVNLGGDSEMCKYAERLCQDFGPNYVINTDPAIFLEHLAWVAYTNDRQRGENGETSC